jgi:hypothetical protein
VRSQRYYRASNNKFWKIFRQRISDPYRYYKKGLKYDDYLLPSGYYTSQTWGALHKSWIGFVIAKEKGELDRLEIYARRIMKLERELGIEITDFSDRGIE